ncbi:MAG: molybdopterin molybdenumtransferase MoeA [Candidatus Schekmanbacteria bacterium]|nr:MAG: molybdopterin molybdenumtransferase MoeA [Candidatus Schekmanbacteria bacterium]
MISVEEAKEIVFNTPVNQDIEEVSLTESLGRVCAKDIEAKITVPPWDNSAMDGFAVKISDIQSASESSGVKLKVIADIPAGTFFSGTIRNGECARIMTGAPIPAGAEAVVMREYADDKGDEVTIKKSAKKDENIRKKGEDIKIGSIVVSKGKAITPADIGVLASVQVGKVSVYRKPTVAILSTGDELVDINEEITPGKIVTSNNYALEAQVLESGAIPLQMGIIKDDKEILRKAIEKALCADIILTTGGVSVGDYDFVKDVLGELGFEKKFWKVAQKPGKPLLFGTMGQSLVFGLPGNPTATMLCFELYVRPMIKKILGYNRIERKCVRAQALEDIKKKPGRKHFIRAITENRNGNYYFRSTGAQGSGILTSMSKANSIAIIGNDVTLLKKGEETEVILLDESI